MLAMFGTLSLGIRLAIIAGALGALVTTFAVWRNGIYQSGRRDAIEAIARNDKAAVDAAWSAREKLTNCESRGLGWDQTKGECR